MGRMHLVIELCFVTHLCFWAYLVSFCSYFASFRVFTWAVLERHRLILQIISVFLFVCFGMVARVNLFLCEFKLFLLYWYSSHIVSNQCFVWFLSFHCNTHAFAQKYNGICLDIFVPNQFGCIGKCNFSGFSICSNVRYYDEMFL